MSKQNLNVVLVALYNPSSLAVHTLHSILKKHNSNVRSVFFKFGGFDRALEGPTNGEVNTLVRLVKSFKPDVVGISVRSSFFKVACMITKELKQCTNTLVVWGGTHATLRPTQCINIADAVCIGEGEGTIVELIERLSRGKDFYDVRGLWVRQGEKVFRNSLRPVVKKLDCIPFPDSGVEGKFVVNGIKVVPFLPPEYRAYYWTMSSQGCFFNCTYCCSSSLKKIWGGVKRRSVENVIAELMYVKRTFKNLREVEFIDDVFTFDITWIKKFCKLYKDKINLPFCCYCQQGLVTEEMISLLKDAGVYMMEVGIQSGSEDIRRNYFGRYDLNKEIINTGWMLHKYGITCRYHLIVDNPLETEKDKKETFKLLLKLPRPFHLFVYSLAYFPETKLTNSLLAKGIISEYDVEDQKRTVFGGKHRRSLDLNRSDNALFWESLYYLAGKRYIPRWFLIWLSSAKWLRRHLRLLVVPLRFISSDLEAIRLYSKIDMVRCYLIMSFYSPVRFLKTLLFLTRAWLKNKGDTLMYYKISQGG